MIRCDMFELEIEQQPDHKVSFLIWSDLPAGTRVNLSCDRVYLDQSNQETLWTVFEEDLLLKPSVVGDYNGASGEIDVEEGDREAFREFEESLSDFSAGIQGPVSDDLIISAIVGARQPLKSFGSGNRNLEGETVEESDGLRVVSAKKSISMPINRRYQPLDSQV